MITSFVAIELVLELSDAPSYMYITKIFKDLLL